jgi:L-rhamnose mutarotase
VKRFCLALDLKDDPRLIAEYKRLHVRIWPEVRDSIRSSGVLDMEIYSLGTRLFMVLDTVDDFCFEAKAKADAANERVQDWERLMGTFQQPLPGARNGEKWMLMEEVFDLRKQTEEEFDPEGADGRGLRSRETTTEPHTRA